jgi:serine phosphatase RsbU (regulator of sigma subunit)
MRSNGSYEESTLQLEPDDTLLLFTDGAIELFDHEDHELGIAGFTRLAVELGAGQQQRRFQLDGLEERLLQFSNQIHLPDDLTLIKVRRRW